MASKPSEIFTICRELPVPKPPANNGLEEALHQHAEELRSLLRCLAQIRTSRQEIDKVKAQKLALNLHSDSQDLGAPEVAGKSQLTRQLEAVLDSSEPLEEKALKVWDIATQVNPNAFSLDAQRSILCESPTQVRGLLIQAYQLWDTFTYKELSILSEHFADVYQFKQAYANSSFIRMVQDRPHKWLSWSLLTASFQAMVRMYVIGLKVLSRLATVAAFDEAFEIEDLLELPAGEVQADLSQVSKFYEFVHPLHQEVQQALEEKCRGYLQGLLKKFLQSLQGSHVLLRLQTSRKIKIEGPAQCLNELQSLAQETAKALRRAPPAFASSIWVSYAKGFEASTIKSAQEILTQFESSKKLGSLEDNPIQQLLLNARRARSIFEETCPSVVTSAFGILDSLIQKLSGMIKAP